MKNVTELLKAAQENNEPTFTFRAKDKHSLIAIKTYQCAVENDHWVTDEFQREIRMIALEFELWQMKNEGKVEVPD